jgi:flagellar basal body-associated protein FliL
MLADMIRPAPLALALLLACAPVTSAYAASKAAPEEARGQRRITSSPFYVPTATLAAPITKDYAFRGLLVVDAGFDIPDPKLRAQVEKMQPRITDALRAALADYTNTRFHAGAAPDADMIARTLQAAADKTLGRPGAKLLLSNVMVQSGR